jgi:hypothetical protein
MRKNKYFLMEAFLKGHRGSKQKSFLGVIGNHYVEILDDDPFIPKFLAILKSKYRHTPSDLSRFLPPDERMILKSHENNSLVIFKTEPHIERNTCSVRLFVYDSPVQRPKDLLTDAMRLAAFRWSKISAGNTLYPLNRSFMQPVAEILEVLPSH